MRSVGRNTLEVINTDGYDVCTVCKFSDSCFIGDKIVTRILYISNPNEHAFKSCYYNFPAYFLNILLQYTRRKIIELN